MVYLSTAWDMYGQWYLRWGDVCNFWVVPSDWIYPLLPFLPFYVAGMRMWMSKQPSWITWWKSQVKGGRKYKEATILALDGLHSDYFHEREISVLSHCSFFYSSQVFILTNPWWCCTDEWTTIEPTCLQKNYVTVNVLLFKPFWVTAKSILTDILFQDC